MARNVAISCRIALSNTFYSPTGHFFAVHISAQKLRAFGLVFVKTKNLRHINELNSCFETPPSLVPFVFDLYVFTAEFLLVPTKRKIFCLHKKFWSDSTITIFAKPKHE